MKYLILPLALLLSACASIHSGKSSNETRGDQIPGLIVSGSELGNPKDESFSMIALTFENQAGEWVRFDKVEVLIDEEAAKTISVVQGKDLLDWASAMEARAKLEQQNREMAQLGLAVAGAATAVVSAHNGNRDATALGIAALGASQAWAVTDALTYRKAWAQNPKSVPSEHVNTPFAVPGKMFLRRWVLLNKPADKMINVLPLALHTVDGRRQVVMVDLR